MLFRLLINVMMEVLIPFLLHRIGALMTQIIINTSYLAINFMFLYSPILSSTHFTYLEAAACFAPTSDLANPLFFKIPVSVVLDKGSGALQLPILNASGHFQDFFFNKDMVSFG